MAGDALRHIVYFFVPTTIHSTVTSSAGLIARGPAAAVAAPFIILHCVGILDPIVRASSRCFIKLKSVRNIGTYRIAAILLALQLIILIIKMVQSRSLQECRSGDLIERLKASVFEGLQSAQSHIKGLG